MVLKECSFVNKVMQKGDVDFISCTLYLSSSGDIRTLLFIDYYDVIWVLVKGKIH